MKCGCHLPLNHLCSLVCDFSALYRLRLSNTDATVSSCAQDVVSQNKKLKKYNEAPAELHKGLKSLSKANRDRLEAYQHLFYLLQTNAVYLARLIFAMPQSRSTKFMEPAILTLFNYASNQREEYLLLKLLKAALEEEISLVSILVSFHSLQFE